MMVLVNRKGLASMTLCNDCGKTIACLDCDSLLSLKKISGKNVFWCPKCKHKHETKVYCNDCGSWDLRAFGIGIEKIVNEIKRLEPEVEVLTFSKDTVRTPAQGLKKLNNFYETPGTIIVGTEMLLGYLTRPVRHVCIATLDNMLSLSDYKTREKMFHLITGFGQYAKKELLLQTRHLDNDFMRIMKSGLSSKFYNTELSIREKTKYPPFSVIIKVVISGQKKGVVKDAQSLMEITKEWSPYLVSGYSKGVKKTYLSQLFFKIPSKNWPNDKLYRILISLPTRYSIEVSPNSTT